MKITILHLYCDLLNLYGEIGNIKVLSKHLLDQGIEILVDNKTVGDNIDFSKYDFIYMGSGTEKNQIVALNDIIRYKNELKASIENNAVILATGNSYEIFGQYILDAQQNKNEALNIFNYYAKRDTDRITSDIIYCADFLEHKIIGFINKMSRIYDIEHHLFNVEFGIGDNEQKDFEGIRYKNFFGTSVIGPILVRNPHLLTYLIKLLCTNKDSGFNYSEVNYKYEQKAYETTLHELLIRKN